MIKSYRLKIIGKVQGVFYRATTRDMAKSISVFGFVRNEPDGSVYAEIEGDEAATQKMIAWCRLGPPGAEVREVIVEEQSPRDFDKFEIKRW